MGGPNTGDLGGSHSVHTHQGRHLHAAEPHPLLQEWPPLTHPPAASRLCRRAPGVGGSVFGACVGGGG